MTRRDLPNLITILRIVLVLPILWFMMQRQFDVVLALFFVAGVSDGIDGYLAKHYHWESELGGWLDPIADKILLVTSYLVLAALGLIPVWLTLAVIVRDLVIVTGGVVYYVHIEKVSAEPRFSSKLNTLMQITLVLCILLSEGLYPLPPLLLEALVWTVLATTVISGLDYVWIWSRRAWRSRAKP